MINSQISIEGLQHIGDKCTRRDTNIEDAPTPSPISTPTTIQPNFAHSGPVESAVFLHHVSDVLQAANRTALEQNFIQSDDDTSRARLKSAGGVGAQ